MHAHIDITQITPFLPHTLVPLVCIQYVYSFQLIHFIVFITTFANAAASDTAETKQARTERRMTRCISKRKS